jgi:hypothetical protein
MTDVALTSEQTRMVRRGADLAKIAAHDPRALRERYQLAELVVDLRATFLDDAGRPDYRGNSGELRAATGLLYDLAGLSKDDRRRLRAAVRHHVSGIIRERLTAEQLAEYGLSPIERNERRRQAHRRDAGVG